MRRILRESHLELSADYESIVGYLTTFQRQGDNRRWDEFRNKMPVDLLKVWGDVLIECRRNGFVGPRAENDKIVFRQIINTTLIDNGDLCTFCERDCAKREFIENGQAKYNRLAGSEYKEQQRPCWEGGMK